MNKTSIIAQMGSLRKAKKDASLPELIEKLETELGVYSELHSKIINAEIAQKVPEIQVEEVQKILKKMRDQRDESIIAFAAKSDLTESQKIVLDKEIAQKAFIETLLPKQLSDEECARITEDAIAFLGAKLKKEMGNVVKRVKEVAGPTVNMKVVSQICSQRLT